MTSDFLDGRKMGKKIVDKTDLIEDVMRRNFSKKLFFARTRKFGKSQLIDQMKHISLGNREVFGPMENNKQQFHIYNSVDLFEQMKKRALLHLDLSLCDVRDPMELMVERLEKRFKMNILKIPSKFHKYKSIEGITDFTIEYLASHSESGEIIVQSQEHQEMN